ncbi:MAG: UDP-3-O-(3-hydroxymyristoyl)glucosamine N-acyltransferase, partial [Proteobacteria bacterium]|nr:UDP-3-O-(3-hydroxymyristoyl)glucosamine N-acyltransferase [Pseudomonadota bacterium]
MIEEGSQIGNDVHVDHNTVIKANTIIYDHVKIGSNCTIGGVGFGYEKDADGNSIYTGPY